MWGERHREAEELGDLRHVLVRADPVRRHVLEHRARVGRGLEAPPRTRHPRQPVHDDGIPFDHILQGAEGQERGGRVATRIRDQPARAGDQLGQSVAPLGEPFGPGVPEAVPGLIASGVAQTVCTRQVDDDSLLRCVDRSRSLVRQADDRDLGPVGESCIVRDEVRHRSAAETRVEGRRRAAGERVGADGDEVERRVPEHAVERFLPRVAGRADNTDRRHGCILCNSTASSMRDLHDPVAPPGCGPPPLQAFLVADALPRRTARLRSAPCHSRQGGIARRRHRAH